MKQKYELSEGIKELFSEAKKEPYNSINKDRGTSIEYLEYLIPEVDRVLQRFEQEIGLNGTSTWKGLRLHECEPEIPLIKTTAAHLTGRYFSHLNKKDDSAGVLLENYGILEMPDDSINCHCYTMPHLAIIRPVHIDAKKHIIKLGLHNLEKKARKSLDELILKTKDQVFKSGLRICDHLNNTYIAFPDILHSLAITYFEIEAHKFNPSLMEAFNTDIKLPPHKSVINALREKASFPIEDKVNDNIQPIGKTKSVIGENLEYLNLNKLGEECLDSVKNYVKSIGTIKEIFTSLSEKDFVKYAELMAELFKSQKPAGILSPMAFLEEHVNVRRTEEN